MQKLPVGTIQLYAPAVVSREELMAKAADMCRHYTGVLGGDILDKTAQRERRCAAGVRYTDVREDKQGLRIPCVDSLRGERECALHAYPTSAELADEEREIQEHIQKFIAVTRGELKECLTFGVAVETYKRVSPCVYAEPCGHRQYQGQLPGKRVQ